MFTLEYSFRLAREFFYLNEINFSAVVEQAEICLIEYVEEKQAVAATTVEVSNWASWKSRDEHLENSWKVEVSTEQLVWNFFHQKFRLRKTRPHPWLVQNPIFFPKIQAPLIKDKISGEIREAVREADGDGVPTSTQLRSKLSLGPAL